ncbi:flagellar hook-basal body complex protein FlhP [Sporosarcina luteola]|uniref:Flagellar hook-basal body complex protein FlhP n=1 Tax=Sporosarcina luteola TaxID=582850 RepID=A0A511Z2S1_9BACL|nr:flagellar hook-basal body protein [Sporosarcina luteola]GEN81754.1 flagellar hook-basal body complex protein FlhP [Sporosarcina luteola]
MIRSMTTAVNTMNQLQSQIDIIGNNLANSATNGYKSSEANFQEMLYQQFNNDKGDTAERNSPAGIRYGVGAMLGSAQMNWKVGSLQMTGRELDFALTEPKQYFNLIMPGEDGEQTVYTRAGNFYVSPVEGGNLMLVNGDGYPVADSAGQPITFAEDVSNYNMLPGGVLEVTHNSGAVQQIQMGVTTLERQNLMSRLSATLFALPGNMADLGVAPADILTEMTGADRNRIGMENQKLEASNVNYEKEMTDLINVQRSYQFNARTVTLADQMLGLINNIR